MTVEEMENVGRRYDAKFGNLDEVLTHQVMFDSKFLQLLEEAIGRGRALTPAEVEAVFPDVAFDY